MATENHRRSSSAKRPAAVGMENKVVVPIVPHAKKRVPLANLHNLNNFSRPSARNQAPAATTAKVPVPAATSMKVMGSAATTIKTKKAPSLYSRNSGLPRMSVASSSAGKPGTVVSSKSLQGGDRKAPTVESLLRPCSMDISPTSSSDAGSISLDETMSTCDSLKSSDIEYLDIADASALASIERKANSNLHITEHKEEASGSICKRELLVDIELDKVVDLDNIHKDPQLCATIACDIYKYLRASENKKRPSVDFMEKIQKDINPSMRAILVDWLVEVAEEYRLVPDTLYLTVNYIDRYLSGNVMNRQRLQLLGVACMMIASKYEEICAPQVEEFSYITDNTYFKEEVLQMESAVLNFLKFEMTAPTVKCFLRRFINAAQGNNGGPSLQLECLANYVAELSLLEYNMLCCSPSLIAASAIFLAKFILQPGNNPWNGTLSHYTLYKPSELCECVKALHRLLCNSQNSSLPAIREKYSQHKYKFVAKKYCPPSIPAEFFDE